MQWSPRTAPYGAHGGPRVPIIAFSDSDDQEDTALEEVAPRRRQGPQNCRRFWGLALAIAAVAGAVLGGALALVTVVSGQASTRGSVSAAEMLEGRQLAEVVSENLAAAFSHAGSGRRLAELGIAPEEVQAVLRDVSNSIKERAPDIHRQLLECQLTPEQQDGLLKIMAHSRDASVQKLGRRLLEGLDESGSSASLTEGMSARLTGQLDEVLVLREQVIPEELLRSREAPGGFPAGALPEEIVGSSARRHAVDPQRMRLVRNFKKWHMEFASSTPEVHIGVEDRRLQQLPPPPAAANPLTAGIPSGMSASVKAIKDQASLYMGRGEAYIKKFPKVHDALFGHDYYNTFKMCARKAFTDKNPQEFYKCFTAYASAAYGAMESVGKGGSRGSSVAAKVKGVAASWWGAPPAPAPSTKLSDGAAGLPGFSLFR